MCAAFSMESGFAVAEGPDRSVDTIVVTASFLDRPESSVTQSVTVIDRQEIENSQVANVTELLRRVVGVNVIQQGGRGGITSAVMRGGEANFTVVLIDGIKVNDSTNTRGGSYDFSYLDIASIDRIEIVRGPMSAVYGSDALAGVINIITRTQDDESRFNAEVGGHGLQSGYLSTSFDGGVVNGRLGVRALNEDGDIEGASYEDWGLDGSLAIDLGASNQAGVQFRYQDATSSSFPEDSGGPALAVLREPDQRETLESHLRLFADWELPRNWAGHVAASRYERDELSDSVGIAPGVFDGVPPNSADTTFTRNQFLLSAKRQLAENLTLLVGGEWQREEGRSSGIIDIGFPLPTDFRLERDTVSAFADIEWSLPRANLQASVRWDNPDEIDAEFSVRAGILVPLAGDNGALTVNWGEAFKAPSFFALAHPLVGNPNLLSESANSFDIGYRRQIGRSTRIELGVYRNRFENFIDFDPVLFTNVNRSEVTTEGAELKAEFDASAALSINAHLTYGDGDIRNSDAELRGRPNWRGGIGFEWSVQERWLIAANLLYLDEFFESSVATGGVFLDGYERLDIAVSYQLSEKLRFGLAIDNALDADYFEAVGFPSAGARARFNVSTSF